jgi:hypothetical protein
VAILAELEVESEDVRTSHFDCPSCEKRSAYELPGKILLVSVRNPFSQSLATIVS